jgi:hypothetical protein
MKKSVLLIMGLTLMAGTLSAQNNETDLRERLMFGLKAGLNISNVYDTKGEDFEAESKTGLAIGGFVSIPFGKYIGVQPEILFSQKGFKGTGTLFGSPYNISRTINFIDVPLLFALKPSEFFTVVAGPQFSYLLSQKNEFKNATTSIAQEQEFENDDIRKNTLCFTGGVDLTLKHLVLGTRVGWDVQSNKGDGSSSTPRYRNVWYQGTIGYRF